MKEQSDHDVVIIGAGIAGCTCAYLLHEKGISVQLVESQHRRNTGYSFSESIPPIGLQNLNAVFGERLELKKKAVFKKAISFWGASLPETKSFSLGIPSCALRVNRNDLVDELRDIVSNVGVEVQFNAKTHIERGYVQPKDSMWHLSITDADGQKTQILTPTLIDATGRSRAVTRNFTRVDHYDRLYATAATILDPNGMTSLLESNLSVVEAVHDGWWYATSSLEASTRLIRFTDHSGVASSKPPIDANFAERLGETRFLREQLTLQEARMVSIERHGSASTTRLRNFSGLGWMAIGDAAATLDPLSSSGITTALSDAKRAVEAICDATLYDATYDAYQRAKTAEFEAYLNTREAMYTSESRWRNQPFWQLRRP